MREKKTDMAVGTSVKHSSHNPFLSICSISSNHSLLFHFISPVFFQYSPAHTSVSFQLLFCTSEFQQNFNIFIPQKTNNSLLLLVLVNFMPRYLRDCVCLMASPSKIKSSPTPTLSRPINRQTHALYFSFKIVSISISVQFIKTISVPISLHLLLQFLRVLFR